MQQETVRSGEKVVGVLRNARTGRAQVIGGPKRKSLGRWLATIAAFPLALAIVVFKHLILRRFYR